MKRNGTIVSVFGLEPMRIGGMEYLARELSVRLRGLGWHSVLCYDAPPPEPVRRFLETSGATIEVLPRAWELGWKPGRDFMRVLSRHRPGIVHLHFTGFLSPYPWLARLGGTRRVFFTDHGGHPRGFVPRRAPLWRRLLTRAVNFPLTGVACVSEYNRRCLLVLDALSPERVHRIHNGVDLRRAVGTEDDAARFRRRFSIPAERRIVLQVSTMTMEKGIADLLRAVSILVPRFPDLHLVLAGDGPSRSDHMRLADEMGLAGRVTWTGLMADPLAEGAFSAAQVVCLLSTCEESFGFVLAEAMLAGRPVIGTRVGGIPELVSDGENGFLVDRGDASAAAGKIALLLDDASLRGRMGQAGRRVVEEKFSLDRTIAGLLRLYRIV